MSPDCFLLLYGITIHLIDFTMSTIINKLYMFYIALDALHDYLLTSETTTTLYYSIHRTLKIRKNIQVPQKLEIKTSKNTSLNHPFHPLTTPIKYKTVVC